MGIIAFPGDGVIFTTKVSPSRGFSGVNWVLRANPGIFAADHNTIDRVIAPRQIDRQLRDENGLRFSMGIRG
jgi:hypothetical protein